MPVILNSSDFPSAPKKGKEDQDTQDKQQPKASDFIYKGPQIPDSMLFGWRPRPDVTDPE